MIYEIKHVELKSIKVNNLQKIIFPHKFLFDSLTKEIEYFKENENVDIYGIFGCYFSIKKKMAVEKKDSKSYYGYYLENNPTDSHISSVLRDSKTLKITENNCYENDDIKVVFAEKGFVLCDNFRHINESEKYNKFNRTLLMFLLALSYNIKSEELSQSVSLAYKNKSYEDMSRLRDEIYAFDLECFFYNPVKHDRQQVYSQWNIISKVYDIKIKHDEMRMQVGELTNIIESKNTQKKQTIFTWVGIALGVASLVSVFKDLKDLVGF